MSPRAFRTPESFYAESVTREMLVDYLTERGFTDVRDNRKFHGKVESQTIHATAPTGERLVIRVRLCWRRRNTSETYSAAQLLPKVKNGDWVGTLQAKVNREVAEGITHSLFVQREINNTISYAALVPQRVLVEIWCAQRDISSALIIEGKLGRRKKSHAMNGASPTLWLNDEHAPKVTDALWNNRKYWILISCQVTFRSGSTLELMILLMTYQALLELRSSLPELSPRCTCSTKQETKSTLVCSNLQCNTTGGPANGQPIVAVGLRFAPPLHSLR